MQNSNHHNMEDKFAMNFGNFDTESLFNATHMGGLNLGMKRTAHEAGLDREPMGLSSDEDDSIKKEDNTHASSSTRDLMHHHQQTNLAVQESHAGHHPSQKTVLPNGKKTKGRVKIKMEFIDNKLRRYTTFSKRKTGIMKKAYELSTLTGTQVMLLVASETGHVYTFATRKLQPMITSEAGKALIQTCLNSPDPPQPGSTHHQHDQRMSATGYEETELTYAVTEEEHKSPSGMMGEDYLNGSSYSGSDSSSPATPSLSPAHTPTFSLASALVASKAASVISSSSSSSPSSSSSSGLNAAALPAMHLAPGLVLTPSLAGGGLMVGSPGVGGGGLVYSSGGGSVMYAPHGAGAGHDGGPPLLLNLPQGLHLTSSDQGSTNHQLVTLPMNLASAAALQQSAAAAAVVSAASAAISASNSCNNNNSILNESLPTDLSLHIKRENRS